ncbi:hypothetical protein QMK33_21355 [Hymenobacter sp. H14-R3]|uniref:hypothetical protein n=1 Tax=Hymenobacter sp. H14-R3 TaxID=3046308 RepID=UPI0024B892D2|nr:hypothetical protein [Hymenobacter sp. H14-R3]MDJ0367701.1 hypothetical protein [Hymenobacter sp. H14-R3]
MLPTCSQTTTARQAGICYLLTIAMGMLGAFVPAHPYGAAATLLSFGCYLGATLFLYRLFAPAHPRLALLAAAFSLVGCVWGMLEVWRLTPERISSLVFFGFYCLLTSYLIWLTPFLPRWLSGLLALSGLGWLTFLSPPLADRLGPVLLVTGLVGEGALALGLLAYGRRTSRPPLTS